MAVLRGGAEGRGQLHGIAGDAPYPLRNSSLILCRENVTAAQPERARILGIHDSGERADGQLWLTTPSIEGESLREGLSRECELSIEDIIRTTRAIPGALVQDTGGTQRNLLRKLATKAARRAEWRNSIERRELRQ